MGASSSSAKWEEMLRSEALNAADVESMCAQRVQELEEELAGCEHCIRDKEAQLGGMQALLAKLERTVEQQGLDSQLKLDRLKALEATLALQQRSTEEKIGKLLLAVAGEKQHAEMTERSAAEKAVELAALQQLFAEETAKESKPESDLEVGEGQQVVQELQQQLADERRKSEASQKRILEEETRLRESQQNIIEVREKEAAQAEITAQLQRQLSNKERECRWLDEKIFDEVNKRAAAQAQLAERDRQLWETSQDTDGSMFVCQQAIQDALIGKGREICDLQHQLTAEMSTKQAMELKVIEKDSMIMKLQQQVYAAKAQQGSTYKICSLPTHAEEEILDPEEQLSDGSSDRTPSPSGEPLQAQVISTPVAYPAAYSKAATVSVVVIGHKSPSLPALGWQSRLITTPRQRENIFEASIGNPRPARQFKAPCTLAASPHSFSPFAPTVSRGAHRRLRLASRTFA